MSWVLKDFIKVLSEKVYIYTSKLTRAASFTFALHEAPFTMSQVCTDEDAHMVNWKEQMHSIKALTGWHVMVHQNVYDRCFALEEASMRSVVFSLPAGQRRGLLLPELLWRLAR